ncbi:hypothetical protein B5566_02465 [Mycobacterium sp. MHSD3]|nr:hypothetical protein B5566_02465 [Mycobacterium sp. MHSD3]
MPCQLLVSSPGELNAHNQRGPRQYATPVDLMALTFRVVAQGVAQSTSVGAQNHVSTQARLTVPHDFPAVKPFDRIKVDGQVFDVDCVESDAANGPFTDLWVLATGAPPGRIILLQASQS